MHSSGSAYRCAKPGTDGVRSLVLRHRSAVLAQRVDMRSPVLGQRIGVRSPVLGQRIGVPSPVLTWRVSGGGHAAEQGA
eukprot:3244631-Rhodomonas_salina.2